MRRGIYRHAGTVCAGVAMEKMALFSGGTFHARQEGTARETVVGCGTIVQASTAGRAGGGEEEGREGGGERGGGREGGEREGGRREGGRGRREGGWEN